MQNVTELQCNPASQELFCKSDVCQVHLVPVSHLQGSTSHRSPGFRLAQY